MLLQPDGTAFDLQADSALDTLLSHAQLQEATAQFLDSPVTTILQSQGRRTVCVFQGEQALIDFQDLDVTIGSEDATTCIIAVLLDQEKKKAWVAHYDEPISFQDTSLLEVVGQMSRPALYLVGAFEEPSGASRTVCNNLLGLVHFRTAQPIRLALACMQRANTRRDPRTRAARPASYHLAVDCSSGRPHPAFFQDRGPELPRRFAFHHCTGAGAALLPVVHTGGRRLLLPGFDARLPAHHARRLAAALRLDDTAFLQRCSTSPDCERSTFVADVRSAYQWLVDAQEHSEQDPLLYEWDQSTSGWKQAASGT